MTNRPEPTRDELMWMYGRMVLSRTFEEAISAAYLEGKVPVFDFTSGPLPGEMHVSSGQEPCAVGVCIHLKDTDYVTAPHRLHHIAIAKGLDLDRMAAEIFGKAAGLSGGRGGHMHLIEPEVRFWSTGIVGQGIGVAAGHALAAKLQGTDDVAVAFIGEAAANQGMFHEAMNLAGVWKLPLICVIEDNHWGVSVSKEASTAVARNSDRASAYNAYGEYVEDNDVWGTYAAVKVAIDRARAGEGPSIIEIQTIRMAGHFAGDNEFYVPEEERKARRDPIDVMGKRLLDEGHATPDELDAIRLEANERVKAADQFARTTPYPEPAEAYRHVFA